MSAGRGPRVLLAAVVTLALGVGSTIAVVGYTSQTNIQIQLSGPSGTVRCDRTATISAKIVGLKNGKPVPNQIVNWSQTLSQSSADGLTARSTVTDSRGRTSVVLVFGPVVGPRTVEAAGQQCRRQHHRAVCGRAAADGTGPRAWLRIGTKRCAAGAPCRRRGASLGPARDRPPTRPLGHRRAPRGG